MGSGFGPAPRAARNYSCWWCGELIRRGEEHAATIVDRKARRAHTACAAAMVEAIRQGADPLSFEEGAQDRAPELDADG